MNTPEHLKYAESHEWIDLNQDPAVIGITDHAQDELSELVYIDLPEVGREVEKGEQIVVVESVKAASDVYAPVSGTIIEVNSILDDDPSTVNSDPYGEGWLVKIKVADPDDADDLLDSEAYGASIS